LLRRLSTETWQLYARPAMRRTDGRIVAGLI
jgi:hypothetical protein